MILMLSGCSVLNSCLYSLTQCLFYLMIDLISSMLTLESCFWPLILTMTLHIILSFTMAVLIVGLPNHLSFLKPVLSAVFIWCPPLSALVLETGLCCWCPTLYCQFFRKLVSKDNIAHAWIGLPLALTMSCSRILNYCNVINWFITRQEWENQPFPSQTIKRWLFGNVFLFGLTEATCTVYLLWLVPNMI